LSYNRYRKSGDPIAVPPVFCKNSRGLIGSSQSVTCREDLAIWVTARRGFLVSIVACLAFRLLNFH